MGDQEGELNEFRDDNNSALPLLCLRKWVGVLALITITSTMGLMR